MTFIIIFLGFIFGAILQYAKLNRYNTISGMATLENLAVAKAIAVAIGIGVIIINLEITLGLASYHVKPFILGGIVLGGLIFGAGMAILGYCPGTLAISLGEGSWDALLGILGGLVGGLVYTLALPYMSGILGPDLGKISLYSLIGDHHLIMYPILFVIGAGFVGISFWMHTKEKSSSTNFHWLYAGIALAILNGIVFLGSLTNRPIGASTSYPYAGDFVCGVTANSYFDKVQTAGNWELWFLAGAFLAGLILSLIRGDFKFTLTHENWIKYKGTAKSPRIIWSLLGGFILIFGARMAGGCTSGHILSGGMQLAASSLVFAVFVFAGLLITGKLFYRKK